MGLDYHGLNFMRHARRSGDFGATVTIARQEVHLNELVVRRLLGNPASYHHQKYCDTLLREHFGASSVDSIDMSSFEDATILHDMNRPLPDDHAGRFDTVIDAGCLEHVYAINTALENCSRLVRPGGQILHVLPANNYCGHGFWQFSPELFFSLYSARNGYGETEVLVSDYLDHRYWYRVQPPRDGKRVNILSSSELYVMVRTVRLGEFSHVDVQQSDYAYEWATSVRDDSPVPTPSGLRGRIMRFSGIHEALFSTYHRARRIFSPDKLGPGHPGIERVQISDMV